MPTGFSALDKVLVGLGSADLVLVRRTPGMGKDRVCDEYSGVGGESGRRRRYAFSPSRCRRSSLLRDFFRARNGGQLSSARSGELDEEEWSKIANAASRDGGDGYSHRRYHGNHGVSGMKAKLRRVKNLGLIVIDYLQLCRARKKTDNRVNEVADISRSLKLMAKEFGVPVICCAQPPEVRKTRRQASAAFRPARLRCYRGRTRTALCFFTAAITYDMDNPVSEAEVIIRKKNRHGSVRQSKARLVRKEAPKFTTIDEDGRGIAGTLRTA